MAVFDPSEQRLCLRVVYDGAAGAGKTTNIRQLGSLFVAQRITEVVSPAELHGRTLFFDWMQISAGAVCGFPLVCQVLSVPGQAAFTARRQALLESADVVVFVCDSSKKTLERAAEALLVADELVLPTGEALPVVFQANKQDREDAVDGKTLLGATRRPNVHVVEAIASEGIGVVDTFVAAVRTAARAIQARIDVGDFLVPVRRAEDEHELLARLLSVPIDREAAAEMLLEEAAAAFALEGVASSFDTLALERVVGGKGDPPRRATSAAPPATNVAPLPTGDVPTGYIWPAHTGRAMLRALSLEADVAVGPQRSEHLAGEHVLTTSLEDRFTDAELARQALVRAARERTQLESLLVPETVLVLQPAPDGSCWLWMVTPRLERIVDWLGADARTRTDLLGTAIGDAVCVSLRHGVAFTPSIGAFGVQSGTVRYVGPLHGSKAPPRSALDLLCGVSEESSAHGIDVDQLVAAMTRRLEARLRPDELALLTQECAAPGDAATRSAQGRIARALRSTRRRRETSEPTGTRSETTAVP